MKSSDPNQLELPLRDTDSLSRELEERTGQCLRLVITDNTSTMMTMRTRRGEGVLEVRLHRMFLKADAGTIAAVAKWVRRVRCIHTNRVLTQFIRDHTHLIRRPPVQRRLRTRGRVFDLERLRTAVNAAEFGGTVSARITWGKRPPGRKRRSIRFGSYSVQENLIRIHPYLDQPFVPEFFVRYIVFHEMLHAHLGIDEGPNGRRRIHPPAFRKREQQYRDYERAAAWERDRANLKKLLG